MLFRLFVILLWLIQTTITISAQKSNYLIIKAEEGQTIYSLLRKYKLLDNPANLQHFYEINKMSDKNVLVAGKNYLLPINLIKFDGKSIRTSSGITNYEKAKEIEKYNQLTHSLKLRKLDYKSSKLIWVPNSFLSDKTSGVTSKISTSQKILNPKNQARELVAERKILPVLPQSGKASGTIVAEDNIEDEDSQLNLKPLVKKVSGKSIKVDLFGSAHSLVQIESDALEGQVFYIVPGHGGPDPGAIVKHRSGNLLCEDEYAYDVSLRLARNLLKHSATVHIIVQDKNDGIRDERYLDCNTSEKVMGLFDMPVNQKKRLKQGMANVNTLYQEHRKKGQKKQWMITIHIDSQPEENRQDVFFYYDADNKRSKRKAEKLRSLFSDKYKNQGRDYLGTVSTRPLYVIRASNPDPIFVELANIKNPKDQERILSPKNRQLLADWMAQAFIQ